MTVIPTLTRWRDGLALRFPRTTVRLVRVREWTRGTWATQAPRDRAWRGAAVGLFVATLVVVADATLQRAMLPVPTLDRLTGVGWDIGAGALGGIGLVVLVAVVSRIPWRYRLTLGVCGGVLAGQFPFSLDAGTLIWGIVAFSAAGAGLATISRENIDEITRLQRGVATVGIMIGLGSVGFLLYWLGNSGDDALEYRNAAVEAAGDDGPAKPDHVTLADPSRAGKYEVQTLTYGTGEDSRRFEFGRDADLITATVDGRPFLNEWTGDSGSERKDFWGFDRDELPVQGRVWYPDGDGPFPLVLIVHGNHSMYEYSDPGYGYLGELLASRGYIFVSVDENFINGRIRQENDARAWLLLEHLAVWRRWSRGEAAAAQNPFAGKVDMSRIGLIGHSRGGEAVAVAAAFNTLPYYPDDATVGFDYGFDIGAVIAIAPIMGQYRPGGRDNDLRDVNYFVIHGANDGDVRSFAGAGQYEHVSFSGDVYRFKSSLYVMGANHGQFNQVWGDHDSGPPSGRGLNTRPLMPGEDQRRIAKVYISAFLEATLRGERGYLPLFVDARAGAEWLPETAYLLEFDDARSIRIATFDEDVDVTTTTIAGGRAGGEHLTVWREQRVSMKSGDKKTTGVYLGWKVDEDDADDEDHDGDAGGDDHDAPGGAVADDEPVGGAQEEQVPRYVIELPDGFSIDPGAALFFSLADANESSARPDHLEDPDTDDQQGEHDGQAAGQDHTPAADDSDADADDGADDSEEETEGDDDDDSPREPIDFTVRVVDADGVSAELPLSRFSMVQPQLEVRLRKAFLGDPETESEAVFQSFVFPLRWFVDANPELDATRPARLELVFDRTASAVVILDTVGFRAPPEDSPAVPLPR